MTMPPVIYVISLRRSPGRLERRVDPPVNVATRLRNRSVQEIEHSRRSMERNRRGGSANLLARGLRRRKPALELIAGLERSQYRKAIIAGIEDPFRHAVDVFQRHGFEVLQHLRHSQYPAHQGLLPAYP